MFELDGLSSKKTCWDQNSTYLGPRITGEKEQVNTIVGG